MSVTDESNRLNISKAGGAMVADYWNGVFTARERGQQVVWYNGSAVNPFFQAAGLAWCHGEAFSARLAAQHLERPAQLAAEQYGYVGELCSYARTHLGCAVLTQEGPQPNGTGVVGLPEQRELASRLPAPDMFVNAYAGCSTGQQWDDISYRVFGKQVPIFNVSLPFLWNNKPGDGYLAGPEWEQASRYVAGQLHELVRFLEEQTGRPFDWDALRQNMAYLKRASELRREAMALCRHAPAPATFWDWIASIAHINFLPASQQLVDYFAAVKAEISQRLADGVSGVRDEQYRVYFDGFMNWNKLGFLARKFAAHRVAVVAGRYTHHAFWQEPQLIDPENPILGMGQHYLLCPTNHGAKTIRQLVLRDCDQYGVDGIVFHSTRTCRAFTNPQHLIAKAAQRDLGIPSMFFEGDVADASFYKDEILESRLLVAQVGKRLPVVLTGGVARNRAAVHFLEQVLETPVTVPSAPQITGAYGAALLARDHAAGRAERADVTAADVVAGAGGAAPDCMTCAAASAAEDAVRADDVAGTGGRTTLPVWLR